MAGLLFCAVACVLLSGVAAASASSPPHLFVVGGGSRGWRQPTGNETETYNHWATKHRFHVGDYLYFKYSNDSVLTVTHDDYKLCNAAKPVARFADGETRFRFGRHGYFYFISGEPGHCEAGERMIVRVMEQPVEHGAAPALEPVTQPRGGDDGRSSSGSAAPNGQTSGASGHGFVRGYYVVGVLVIFLSVLVLA